MSWVDETLADYGRSLGLPTLEFNDDGVASVRFERLGELYIERLEDGVLIYVTREYDQPDATLYANALAACHWELNPPMPVNSSLHGDRLLVFSATLADSEFDVPATERTIDYLGRMHDVVLEGASK